jgi:hypothetical protein
MLLTQPTLDQQSLPFDSNIDTDNTALQAPAAWLRQLMGARSQTGDKVWGRVFTVC